MSTQVPDLPTTEVGTPVEPPTTVAPEGSKSVLRALEVFVVLRFAFPAKLVIGPLGQIGSPATIWGLLCLLWYLSALVWRDSGLERGRQPLRWCFAFVLCAWLLSYGVIPLRLAESFEQSGADVELIQMLSMVGIGLLAADGLRSRDQVVKLLRFTVIVAAFSSLVALAQFAGTDPVTWITSLPGFKVSGDLASVQARGSFNRSAGTTSHPIEFATVTAMILPIALQLWPWQPNKRRWGVIVMVILLGIPAALSRSGFLGLFVGLLVVGVSWDRERRRRSILVGIGIAMVLFVTVPGLIGTTTRLFTQASSDSSISTRTDDYAAVQPMIEQAPILGRGIGTFIPPRYRILDNQYLVTLIEAGVVGVISLLFFIVVTAVTTRDAWCHAPPGEFRDATRGVLAAVLVGAVSLAVFDAFSFETFSGAWFLFAGIGGAAWRLTKRDA